MKEVEYRSQLSPEELKRRLSWETAVQNEIYKKTYEIILRWKSEWEFTLRTREVRRVKGHWSYGTGPVSAPMQHLRLRWGHAIFYSQIFSGRILSTKDGCAVRGCFKLLPLVWILMVTVGAAFLLAGLAMRNVIVGLFGSGPLLTLVTISRINRNQVDQELLDLIVYLIRDPDEPAPLCDGMKSDDDIKE